MIFKCVQLLVMYTRGSRVVRNAQKVVFHVLYVGIVILSFVHGAVVVTAISSILAHT